MSCNSVNRTPIKEKKKKLKEGGRDLDLEAQLTVDTLTPAEEASIESVSSSERGDKVMH